MCYCRQERCVCCNGRIDGFDKALGLTFRQLRTQWIQYNTRSQPEPLPLPRTSKCTHISNTCIHINRACTHTHSLMRTHTPKMSATSPDESAVPRIWTLPWTGTHVHRIDVTADTEQLQSYRNTSQGTESINKCCDRRCHHIISSHVCV
jgi:hypothetical protein